MGPTGTTRLIGEIGRLSTIPALKKSWRGVSCPKRGYPRPGSIHVGSFSTKPCHRAGMRHQFMPFTWMELRKTSTCTLFTNFPTGRLTRCLDDQGASRIGKTDFQLQCQAISHGLVLGADGTPLDKNRLRELAPGAADWKLLLQLDSDEGAGMDWGDSMISFWIREKDLQDHSFSEAWMIEEWFLNHNKSGAGSLLPAHLIAKRRSKWRKKKLQDKLNKAAEPASTDPGVTRQEKESSVFYRCTCPECGEDTLELSGFSVFYRSKFLGVTDEGEFGCGDLGDDGEYDWVIECSSCGYRVFDTQEVTLDNLSEWASKNGKTLKRLESEFLCPVCGTKFLDRIERGNREVRAVYENADDSETWAEVALSFGHYMSGGETVRYCCMKGHELTKEDGTPVKTAEETRRVVKSSSNFRQRIIRQLPGQGHEQPLPGISKQHFIALIIRRCRT